MNDMTSRLVRGITVAAVVGLAGGLALNAQQAPSVKRNIVYKQDMSIPDREGVMALVELPPGSAEGTHTHPAEVFHVAPGKVHQAINNGTVTARLGAVFVAEKGKPLTTPTK